MLPQVVESDGPMQLVYTGPPFGNDYQARCTFCRWSGPPRRHRIDAEEDFDAHQH